MTNFFDVERCLACGTFYAVPAAERHTPEDCEANRARQPLPTREPGRAKLPNRGVKIPGQH